MKLELDVKLTGEDMYRFNMYHIYSGAHGIFSIVIAILAFVVSVTTYGKVETMYTALYVLCGFLVLFYEPVTLKLKSKHQIAASQSLQENLHYVFDSEGVHVSQEGSSADLPWKQVYKMVATKSNVLIYSNRVNAFVIPRAILGDQYPQLKELAEKCLEKYRIRMK